MKQKLADFLYIFCLSAVGMSIALFLKTDIVSLLFVLVFAVLFSLAFSLVPKICLKTKLSKIVYCIGALLSCAVSVYTASALCCRFTLNKTFLALLIFITLFAAVVIANCSVYSVKYTVCVISVVAIIVLAIIFALSVLGKDFTKTKCLEYNFKSILPLSVFSCVDGIFVLKYVKKSNRALSVIAFCVMPIFILINFIASAAILSNSLFCNLNTPILTMWQICYIPSFINRFETVVISSIFALGCLKSGIMLKSAFDVFGKKPVLVLCVLAAVILLFFSFNIIYAYSVLTLLIAVFLLVGNSCKK